MKTTYYLFFKFSVRNIFINAFKQIGTQRIPIVFRNINLYTYDGGKSNASLDNTKEFAQLIARWVKIVKPKHAELVVIFKHFGMRFKKREQSHYGTDKQRKIFIDAFTKEKVAINHLIDATGIPFNGCKGPKARRKKRKLINKDTA